MNHSARITLSIFLCVFLVIAFVFNYFLFSLKPFSEQLLENQRNFIFTYVVEVSQELLNKPDGVDLVKVYLGHVKDFSSQDLSNVALVDQSNRRIWSINKIDKGYAKTSLLHLNQPDGHSVDYRVSFYFNNHFSVFSIPWPTLSAIFFLGLFFLYEFMIATINNGLALSRWCYRHNLYKWVGGDFCELAFLPSKDADQLTKKQMTAVQSINEIFSFVKRRCYVLQNSTSSKEILQTSQQMIVDASQEDNFSHDYIKILRAWAPMSELRWISVLLGSFLGLLLIAVHVDQSIFVLTVFPPLFIGSYFAQYRIYNFSRRFYAFLGTSCLLFSFILSLKFSFAGMIFSSFFVGSLCQALSMMPAPQKERYFIIPEHEFLSWPVRSFLMGFFIPLPIFYIISARLDTFSFKMLPLIFLFVLSLSFWRLSSRHPAWNLNMMKSEKALPLKKHSFFLFFSFFIGGICQVIITDNSPLLALWFVALYAMMHLFHFSHHYRYLKYVFFAVVMFVLLIIPFLSGFIHGVVPQDGLLFLSSLLCGVFVQNADKKKVLASHMYSPVILFALVLGGGFFILAKNLAVLNLTLSLFSIIAALIIWQYGERNYAD